MLEKKGHTMQQIAEELQFLYGRHVISERKDRFVRTKFDF